MRKRLALPIALFFLSIPLLGPVLAQRTFQSKVDLVVLNVTVIDANSKPASPRFVKGLTQNDFKVYEDGIGQDISFFTQSDLPLEIALIIDTSASMSDKMKLTKDAAVGFIRNMRPQDSAEILGCDAKVKIYQNFTDDKNELEKSIKKISAGGTTALYNSIYVAVNEINKRQKSSGDIRRQAIVILSDGEDTASLITSEEALKAAQKANVSLYTISLRSPLTPAKRYFSESDFVMGQLARETGGRTVSATQPEDLRGIYGNILDEIMSQYTIGYESKNKIADGKWRRIIVQVLKPGVTLRTKNGYEGPTISFPKTTGDKSNGQRH